MRRQSFTCSPFHSPAALRHPELLPFSCSWPAHHFCVSFRPLVVSVSDHDWPTQRGRAWLCRQASRIRHHPVLVEVSYSGVKACASRTPQLSSALRLQLTERPQLTVSLLLQRRMMSQLTPGCGLHRRTPFQSVPLCASRSPLQRRPARRAAAAAADQSEAPHVPFHRQALGLGMALALGLLQATSVQAKTPAGSDPYEVGGPP